MKKVTKALIPAAGLGTRFLPATKTIPKELLPIVDKPSLLYVIEEIIACGIEDIVLVAGRGKSAIEDFFDRSYELEDTLAKAGKTKLLESIQRVKGLANIISIRQKEALGLGHAVWTGKPAIGDEPFCVLLPDEIMVGTPSPTSDLMKSFQSSGLPSVTLMEVAATEVSKYGIIKGEPTADKLWKIQDVIEKPTIEEAPSRFALPGRYLFTAQVFEYLRDAKPGKNGEIQLTDAMTQLARREGLLGVPLRSRRYDTGDKFGFLQANLELALEHPDLAISMRTYLKNIGGRL